jgi:orotate phosphoribosyltransferase
LCAKENRFLALGEFMKYDKAKLIELVKRYALKTGDFTLASGKQASFYLDCRKLTLSSEGAAQIAAGILELIGNKLPDAIGGMAIGADPITGAVVHAAGIQNLSLKGFIVRKEEKRHGTGQMVEGPVQPGDRAIIVEDVVTTGGSSLQAIDRCQDFGMMITKVIAIVDRLEGGAEKFRSRGIEFESLLTVADLGLQPVGS